MSIKQAMLLLLLHVVIGNRVNAQCHLQLSGTVKDKHNREELSFALIEIKELALKTQADSLGNYRFRELCPGNYTIYCSHFDCDTLVKKINLGKNMQLNFYPEHHDDLLDEVEVYGRMKNDNKTRAKEEIKGLEFEKIKGKTLGRALRSVTGVNLLQTGPTISKPVIHGLHSNRVLIMNNGVRQEGQQWGNEHAPEVDPFIANSLTIIKGANAVRYGSDAIGGVILVDAPALPDSGKFGGEVNMVGFSNGRGGALSAMLQQNFKKWKPLSWRAQGTVRKHGNMKTPGYYLKNTGTDEYNFSYAMGYHKRLFEAEVFYSQFNTNIGIFTGSHIGNVTDLQHAIALQQPAVTSGFSYDIARPYQHIEHELFKARMRISTGVKGNFHVMYARQYNIRQEYDKDKPLNDSIAGLNLPELDFGLTTHLTEMYWEHVNIKGFTGKIGVNGITQGNTYRGRFFIPNFRSYSGGIFFIERKIMKKAELEMGFRYDYKYLHVYMYEGNTLVEPEHNFSRVSANAGLLLRQGEKSRLILNAATAWRAPGVNELYSDGLHHGAATVEKGNDQLSEEVSLNMIVNWQYNSEKIFFETEPYINYFFNYINLVPVQPATVTIRGAFPTYAFTQVDAMFMGIDAKLRQKYISWLTLTTKATILRARDLSADNWLFGVPADRFEQEINFNFREGKKWKQSFAGIGIAWTNKQFRVPAGIDYMSPPNGYLLLGVEAGTCFHVNGQEFLLGIEAQNLLNKKYRDFMNRFRYYTDETGINFNLRLTYKF